MSHFAYTRPSWTSGTALYAGEMEELDVKTFKAINGDDGGTWAPVSVIDVGGAGCTLKLVGDSVLTDGGTLSTSGFATIVINTGAGFQMWGEALFYGDTYILDGNWSFSVGTNTVFDAGSVVTTNGILNSAELNGVIVNVSTGLFTGLSSFVSFGGNFTVSGTTNLANTNINGDANFLGTTYLSGNTTIEGPATITNTVSCSGIGRVIKPAIFTINSGNGTISPTVSTKYLGQNLTGTVSLQIDDTGAVDGDELIISNRSSTYYIYIYDTPGAGGGLLAGLLRLTGSVHALHLVRIGGLWYNFFSV